MKNIVVFLSLVLTLSGLKAQSEPKRIDLDSFYSYEHSVNAPLFTALDSNMETPLKDKCGVLKLRLVFDSIPNYLVREDKYRNIVKKYKIVSVNQISNSLVEYLVFTEVGRTVYTVSVDDKKNFQVYCHWTNQKGMIEGWQSVGKL